MKIHILSLTWNGLNSLLSLHQGLDRNISKICYNSDSTLKEGWEDPEWYIRDNGSKDGTEDILNCWKYRSDYRLKTTVFNVGHNRHNFSQGVNYLFDKANPKDDDIILLLNNDIIFNDDDSLLKMYNLMTDDVGIVGTRLVYPGTNKLQHAGIIFSQRYNSMPFHFRPNEESDINSEKNRYFQAVTGACCFVNVADFKKVGGLCEDLNWAFEDVMLNLKIGQTKKIIYCGETEISHHESLTLKKNPVNKLFLNQNVDTYRKLSQGLYHLDYDLYLNNSHYNEVVKK